MAAQGTNLLELGDLRLVEHREDVGRSALSALLLIYPSSRLSCA
jgi:hypothetical protein